MSLTKVLSALDKAEAAKREAIKIGKDSVREALQQFFHENPEIVAFGWAQYTPYFNDGEPCIFHMWDVMFLFDDKEQQYKDLDEYERFNFIQEEGQYYWGDKYDASIPGSAETQANCRELCRTLKKVEPILKDVFGDHIYVVVDSDGITIEEYDHD